MRQYMLSVYQPDTPPPPSVELERINKEVLAWCQALKDAGEWVFTGRLHPASTATVVRRQDDEALVTDGPYTEGKEHIGGFTIIRVADLDAALERAEGFTRITTLPVEVRPMVDDD
ncbi:YciI family protein [Actinoallomurus rhizosphaericola]|uniref:YciI family protein n=1 Tax=Actinoallomurus rhizosphaericola TaxID=2952536 RepID=UPI0020917977|nr:YciI family protein [Actinoallomurus rhizosphaericola]MCO5993973.1 YciI family protein [Actinoallomurus rhizosphaericola]